MKKNILIKSILVISSLFNLLNGLSQGKNHDKNLLWHEWVLQDGRSFVFSIDNLVGFITKDYYFYPIADWWYKDGKLCFKYNNQYLLKEAPFKNKMSDDFSEIMCQSSNYDSMKMVLSSRNKEFLFSRGRKVFVCRNAKNGCLPDSVHFKIKTKENTYHLSRSARNLYSEEDSLFFESLKPNKHIISIYGDRAYISSIYYDYILDEYSPVMQEKNINYKIGTMSLKEAILRIVWIYGYERIYFFEKL